MRKRIFITILLVIGVVFIAMAIYWFSTSRVRSLNNHWGLDLPYSVDITYFDASSAMSEGHAYYEIDLNGYNFTEDSIFDIEYDSEINIQENYDSIIDLCKINDTSEIDWDSDVEWTALKSKTGRMLIIVYDYGKKAIIINEKGMYEELK